MPADALYWNSVDFDSDESINNTFPRHYVDPWDLENYAYIREHLDSVEVSSEQSSFGEPIEVSSSFYYSPLIPKAYSSPKAYSPPKPYSSSPNAYSSSPKTYSSSPKTYASSPKAYPSSPKAYSPPIKEKFDTLLDSDYGTAKYAVIEDAYGEAPRRKPSRQRVKDIKKPAVEDLYGIASFGLESDVEESSYVTNNRSTSTTLYESARQRPPVTVKRRMSYSYGDYGYNTYHSIYSRMEDSRRSESGRPTPIYDDIRSSKFKPNNFGLSNYGHLQIDYSFSWNNLDKYIYN